MVKVVCWNIGSEPWHCLVKMAERGEADVAILQEAGHLPGDLIGIGLTTVLAPDGVRPLGRKAV